MENLIENVKNLYIILLIIMLVIVVLDVIFEKQKNRKQERELEFYELKYQKLKKDFNQVLEKKLSISKGYQEHLSMWSERSRANIRDLKDLKKEWIDLVEKLDYWKSKAQRLQNQLNYQKRKCKNNNIK